MLFPSASPSLEQCTRTVADALQDDGGRIYLDANVLIHCYEMSAGASEDLLKTFERYGDRVGVPIWAARETWDYVTKRARRSKPLNSLAERMKLDFKRFRRETTRYIDDTALGGDSRDDFQKDLDDAIDGLSAQIHRVSQHEPRIDQTTDRLLPFIEGRRLPSRMQGIFEKVARTAPFRMAHRIPPGFGDAPFGADDDEESESERPSPKRKGKSVNPNGDLIIWLEILEDCARNQAEHLVIVTRDTQKDDWVFTPKRVKDSRGRSQENRTGITLPLPLLVYEAREGCPSLKSVSIISVDILASIWTSQRFDISRLAAALQAESEDNERADVEQNEPPGRGGGDSDSNYVAEFLSSDMHFEPDEDEDDELGRLVLDLGVDGWRSQNQAVRRLEPQLGSLDRSQRIYVGRELASAAAAGAVEPAELLERVLANAAIPLPLRSDILIGVMAETYVDEAGEPKKPMASRAVTDTIYQHYSDQDLGPAYEAVLARLTALRREYLALPQDTALSIRLDIALQGDQLVNVSANDVPILEEHAPSGRALQKSGNDVSMTVAELIDVLAEEFVVPEAAFEADRARSTTLTIPEHLGFVIWGPKTGNYLR